MVRNYENLRGTRRWCQKSKRNFLQDSWNGKYEFHLFNARKSEDKALPEDFIELMQEPDEERSSRSSTPGSLNVTWANEMQVTTGTAEEEQPFSEDEDIFALDFPEEHLNKWDDREWRDKYEIALNEAFQRVYDRNEGRKNDPAQANLKPADIDPFWSHALQEIKHRNREEDRKLQENMNGFAEMTTIEVEDESEISASAIYTATESETAISENLMNMQEVDLNEAVIGIESNLLGDDSNAIDEEHEDSDIVETAEENAEEETGVQMEGPAEVLVIERQEDVISNDDIDQERNVLQVQRNEGIVTNASSRFDADSFKARLIDFRKRQEIEWIYRNINKN